MKEFRYLKETLQSNQADPHQFANFPMVITFSVRNSYLIVQGTDISTKIPLIITGGSSR